MEDCDLGCTGEWAADDGGGGWGLSANISALATRIMSAIIVLENSSERAPDLHPCAASEDKIVSIISVEGDERS